MWANELARAVTTLRATTPPAWIPTAPVSAEHNTVTLRGNGLFCHDGEFSYSTNTSLGVSLCLNNSSKVSRQSVRRVNGFVSPRAFIQDVRSVEKPVTIQSEFAECSASHKRDRRRS